MTHPSHLLNRFQSTLIGSTRLIYDVIKTEISQKNPKYLKSEDSLRVPALLLTSFVTHGKGEELCQFFLQTITKV